MASVLREFTRKSRGGRETPKRGPDDGSLLTTAPKLRGHHKTEAFSALIIFLPLMHTVV
jgi:hypothetical protein